MNLEKIVSRLHYRTEIEQAVLQKIRKDKKLIEKLAGTAYHGENFHFALCKRMPLTRLAVVTYLLVYQYDAYKSKKIPDEIIFDTFRDVSLRANLYYEKTARQVSQKRTLYGFVTSCKSASFKLARCSFNLLKCCTWMRKPLVNRI